MPYLLYQEVYNQLKQDIVHNRFIPGEKLPPEFQLRKRFSVSVGTVRKAVDRLIDERLLKRRQGSGTFVIDTPIIQDKTDFDKSSSLTWGHVSRLSYQDRIDEALLGENREMIRYVSPPSPESDLNDTSGEWKDLSIVQLSDNHLHMPGIEDRLLPAPSWITDKCEDLIDIKIINECSSRDGELLLLPFAANPSLCYINLELFEEAGIKPPLSGWNWQQLYEICKKLKKLGTTPLGLSASPGNLFEIFLRQAGGDYFDDNGKVFLPAKAFNDTFTFLKTLQDENLAINFYKLPIPYKQFIKENRIGIIFLGPLLTHFLADQTSKWSFAPLPERKKQAGCYCIYGLGVTKTSTDPDTCWQLLNQIICGNGMKRLLSCPFVFPARTDCMKEWTGHGIKNPGIVCKEMENAAPIQTRKGFLRWWNGLYKIFDEAIDAKTSIANARSQAVELLQNMQVQPYERYPN